MTLVHRRAILLPLLALVAAGCSDLLRGDPARVGEITLRYEGAESGTYRARGARPLDWDTRTHAAGLRMEDGFSVVGHVVAGSTADAISIVARVTGAGTHPITDGHGPGTVHAQLALGIPRGANHARALYVFTSGTLALEPDAGDGRIRGSFEGTARLIDGNATIQVTQGRFDVPDNLPRPVD